MKIANTADVHSNNFKQFDHITDKSGSYRLDLINDSLETIGKYCLENEIKYLLIAGDLFHTRGKVSTLAYNYTCDKIISLTQSFGITVIILAGNHDQADNSDSPQSSLQMLGNMENIVVVEKPQVLSIYDSNNKAIDLVCVPYLKNTEIVIDFINSYIEENSDKEAILMTHLGVSGATVGKNSYPMQDAYRLQDLRPDFFKYVVLGHYHKFQMLDKNVFYCGSPTQLSFNDEDNPSGFVVIDTDKKYSVDYISMNYPKFITIDGDSVSKETLDKHNENGDFLRINIKQEHLQELNSKIPEGLNYNINLIREYTKKSGVDIRIGMSFKEIVEKYADTYNKDAKKTGLNILDEVLSDE